MNKVSLEERLGEIIADERAGQITDEFYEEVTKKDFDYYYSSATGQKPMLEVGKHGGFESNGKYYMINRKKIRPIAGKKFSLKQELSRQTRLAYKLMSMGFDQKTIVTKQGKQVVIHLGYSRYVPSDYKMMYVDWAGQNADAPHSVMKQGRMSSLDKLLVKSIKRWAQEEGLGISFSIVGGNWE